MNVLYLRIDVKPNNANMNSVAYRRPNVVVDRAFPPRMLRTLSYRRDKPCSGAVRGQLDR